MSDLVPGTDEWFFKKAHEFIKIWAGGIAQRPANEDPGGLTNEDITLETWQNYAPKVGLSPDANALINSAQEERIKVAREIWKDLTKDTSDFPWRMKMLIFEIRWASGPWFERYLQARGRSISEYRSWQDMLTDFQYYLRSLPNYIYNPGWNYRYGILPDPYGRKSWPEFIKETEQEIDNFTSA